MITKTLTLVIIGTLVVALAICALFVCATYCAGLDLAQWICSRFNRKG